MLLSKKIFLAFLASSICISNCANPSTLKQNDKIDNTTKKTDVDVSTIKKEEKITLKETNIQFTQKIDGVDNPIAPENITSVEIGNKIIEAKDIKIVINKFNTKAVNDDITVNYLGSGRFKFNFKSENLAKFDNSSVKFNLAKFKKTVEVPLLKGILDNNIRMSYDSSTNKTSGGIADKDGSIDKTKPIFNIENDKFILQEFDGKETIFGSKDFIKPESTSIKPQNTINEQIEKVNKAVPPPNPFYPYVGSWAFDFTASGFGVPGYNDLSGQRLTVTFIDLGNSKFKVIMKSFDLVGNTVSDDFVNTGSYADLETVFVSVALIDWNIKLSGDNVLKATLKDTLMEKYRPYKGISFDLQRVPSSNYTGASQETQNRWLS